MNEFIHRFVTSRAQLVLAICAYLSSALPSRAFASEPEIAVGVRESGETFIVEATIELPIPRSTAWEVLTDFDHMAAFLNNLTLSRVVRRDDQIVVVQQKGITKYGPFSFSYESEKEIRLEPMTRISAKQLSGTVKRLDTDVRLAETQRGTHLEYRAEIMPNSVLARIFGASSVRDEVVAQLQATIAEMRRRQKPAVTDPPASANQ
jgi:carbon monoxide dehydrogenase subunit G